MIKTTVRIEDKDTGLGKIKKEFKGGAVDIGIFGDQGSEAVIIAATNEFGTDIAGPQKNIKIPQRSFLRAGVDEKKSDIADKLDKGKNQIVRGKMTTERFLKGLGIYIADKIIVERIKRSKEWAVPNAPATIEKKTVAGKVGDQPLIDTTTNILQRITYRVVKGR